MPYFNGEADADVRWVKHDTALYKDLVGAMANECFVYLYHGILYNIPAVPARLDPITVSLVGDILVFLITGKDEVAENIEGFSDVVYAVTLLTVGEVLLYTAIKKGRGLLSNGRFDASRGSKSNLQGIYFRCSVVDHLPSRIAEPSASDTTAIQEFPFITFPPFPKPPPGVTLIPFKDFRVHRIQLFAEAVGGHCNFITRWTHMV
ncbi:uncharacterized protein EDB93DRAFT_1108862 [Suillus bovinus]|uniref:uncharacterized protein n=1 Tax=Suillus bovinus TaxID=48563 RepID=UPI001B864354|nr:uncharacterized protein EDB93DRAFT_1108862 [Suillus bovinus]KAG2128938.1 hypothetical protein EDB93DRAFT_1108862 [Suillus bovinus]